MEFLQTRPALLYWSDSWFSTPLYLNLARQSLLRIDGMAMLMGKPGATASELFTAAHIRNITARVLGSPFDIVCISAGGNDQLSERLEHVLPHGCRPGTQQGLMLKRHSKCCLQHEHSTSFAIGTLPY
jgi:hypothetical protein